MSDTSKAYGPPSEAALAHASRDYADGDPGKGYIEDGVRQAHDPALGLDGSICKRAVIDMLRGLYDPRGARWREDASAHKIADRLEVQWSNGR